MFDIKIFNSRGSRSADLLLGRQGDVDAAVRYDHADDVADVVDPDLVWAFPARDLHLETGACAAGARRPGTSGSPLNTLMRATRLITESTDE
jgi:hypothetical protein